MFAGASRFHGRIERQEIRLARDLLDNVDLFRDCLHRRHGLGHRFPAGRHILRGFAGDLVGGPGVIGIPLDARSHLLHRTGAFLGSRALLARSFRKLLGRGAHLFGARRHRVRDRDDFGHHVAQVGHHLGQREREPADFVRRFNLGHLSAIPIPEWTG